MADNDASEKNLEPTSRRREEFRKQGKYARARDLSGVAVMGAVLGLLSAMGGPLSQGVRTLFGRTLGDVGALTDARGERVAQLALGLLGAFTVPSMIVACVAGVGAGILQAGWHVHWETLAPTPERFDVFAKLKQTLSPTHAFKEVGLALLRVGLVAAAVNRALERELPGLMVLSRTPLDGGSARMMASVSTVVVHGLAATALLAAVDYGQSWFALRSELRMSRKDMEDETKQSEGDPKTKGRMRSRARAMLKKRSVARVKEADVVVTNPTHVAVALRYGVKDAAPVVVAKGHDALAMMIRAEARRHGVPILEHRALARALDADVEVGRAIPAKHFQAVAKVLAFVFRLKGRRAQA